QQNAALVEEASAAARAMEEQAGGLAQAIAVFRVEGGAAGTGTGSDTRAPAIASAHAAVTATVAPRRAVAPRVFGNTALSSNADWAEF
ncbi:MAG: chemotaxis protein, partial [Pseudoxanthomonas sp.]|nr:chemotaxis protein [Pseudoxanthomonas sp.]